MKKLFLSLLCLGMMAFAFAACGSSEESAANESASNVNDSNAESAPKVVVGKEIFWNTDYKEYLNYEGNTRTERKKNDNIFYYVKVFLEDGTEADRVIQGTQNIEKVDANRFFCMGETFYGVATKVQTVEEAGYTLLASNFYVSEVNGDAITLKSAKTLEGETVNVKLTENTKLVLLPKGVFGTAEATGEVVKYDRVYAIGDEAGNASVIYIAERASSKNFCEACNAEVVWQDWTDTKKLPSSTGHFRLMVDGQTSGQVSMAENVKICLDLNGHTFLGGAGARIYSLHNPGTELSVMDHSPDESGCLKAVGNLKNLQGGVLWARYGILRIYSGTYDASGSTNDFFGCAVCIESGATGGYMYGGTLIGGATSAWYDTAKSTYRGGYGGTVCVNGYFEFKGGTIKGGSVYMINSGGDVNGLGGAVCVTSIGTMLMTGGTIEGGVSDRFGGALFNAGKLTIEGGTIRGGKALQGDNLYTSNQGKTIMTGGRIEGGVYTAGVFECADPKFILK